MYQNSFLFPSFLMLVVSIIMSKMIKFITDGHRAILLRESKIKVKTHLLISAIYQCVCVCVLHLQMILILDLLRNYFSQS